MTFDDITENGKLWAVRFNGELGNELSKLFTKWNDADWLHTFFIENIDDLSRHFKITDITQAVKDTIEDSEQLECVLLDLSPQADLSMLFRPLNNNAASNAMLQKEKARLKRMATFVCYQISFRCVHHYWRSHQTHSNHAGKRTYPQ